MKIVAYYYHYYGHDSLLKLDSLNPNSILFLWHNVTGVSEHFRPEKNLRIRTLEKSVITSLKV